MTDSITRFREIPRRMITVKGLRITCFACPSQWEGITDDDQEVYIRYRWGHLSVRVSGTKIFSRQIGNEYDGVLDTTDMLAITGIRKSE